MKYIIFDFDGVIEDTFELTYNINAKYFHDNLTKENYRDFFMGNLFEKFKKNEEKKDYKPKKYTRDDFWNLQHEKFKELIIINFIKKSLINLSKTYKLFIVTSNKEETLNLYFKKNEMENIFIEILGYETEKSKIKKFQILFDKYNFKPEESIFITDTVGDVLEAKEVGLKSIAVTFGYHNKHRLESVSPYKIVDNFSELEIEIDKLNNLK